MLGKEASGMGNKHSESMNLRGPLLKDDFGPHRQLVHHLSLLLVQFVQNKHTIEAFQIEKHHEDLTLSITVWHIDQVIQITKKL